jgi:hypothetical protein
MRWVYVHEDAGWAADTAKTRQAPARQAIPISAGGRRGTARSTSTGSIGISEDPCEANL